MKRGCGKFETYMGVTRVRWVQILALIGLLYMIFMTFEVPFVFMSISRDTSGVSLQDGAFVRPQQLDSEEKLQEKEPLLVSSVPSGLIFDWRTLISTEKDGFLGLNKSAINAFELGEKLWEDLKSGKMKLDVEKAAESRDDTSCPNSVSLSGAQFVEKGKVMTLPCGLTVGSHITVVAKPKIVSKDGDQSSVMVSQFMLELVGLETVDGEDPPRILHYNPRLKGDWSGKPVIEQNTFVRQQWGSSVRCQGWRSMPDEETGECFNHHLFIYNILLKGIKTHNSLPRVIRLHNLPHVCHHHTI